ncbi:hypothetical protein ZYGR_0AY00500 [Zygosaccharomyces rouxii]|uniref:Metallothionein n=1 Tax=Zygosaccharomyces rouxii TaxID=4956 RepID=A0A1Q3AIT7_ZYGRO|nr:hypothetical protein ZYGR_0AY00500 [Zygosaccharomyces rouxii]
MGSFKCLLSKNKNQTTNQKRKMLSEIVNQGCASCKDSCHCSSTCCGNCTNSEKCTCSAKSQCQSCGMNCTCTNEKHCGCH